MSAITTIVQAAGAMTDRTKWPIRRPCRRICIL